MKKITKKPYQLTIEAGQTSRQYWIDVWNYRAVFYILSWRDLKVRYKQTFIGILWALIRPLATLLIFTFVFGSIAQLETEGQTPYAILVLCGLLPWQFFSSAVNESSHSLINNESLITKVYFPRVIIPASSMLTALVDFFISLCLFLLLLVYYQYIPSLRLLFLPVFLFLTLLLSLGIGLLLAAMNVKFRDVRYVLPFLLQIGLFISPVGFSSNVLPLWAESVYPLNPLVGIIDAFRWCLTSRPFPTFSLGISVLMTALLFLLGLYVFCRMERGFSDHI